VNEEHIEIFGLDEAGPGTIERDPQAAIALAAECVGQADALLITAGAGMGVDSGLPDFRGDEGLWRHYPALRKQHMGFEHIANPQSFERDPWLAWGFYGHRLQLYRDIRPHGGFARLLDWAKRMPQGAFVFTSNVDGQFQKAGFDPDRIVECHGSIHHLQCTAGCQSIDPADGLKPRIDVESGEWQGDLPICPRCGHLARPNILMFQDSGWLGERTHRQRERYRSWLETVGQPLVIEIGAGTHIPTVRLESEYRSRSGRLIRINTREPGVSTPRQIALNQGAAAALEAIGRCLDAGA